MCNMPSASSELPGFSGGRKQKRSEQRNGFHCTSSCKKGDHNTISKSQYIIIFELVRVSAIFHSTGETGAQWRIGSVLCCVASVTAILRCSLFLCGMQTMVNETDKHPRLYGVVERKGLLFLRLYRAVLF